MTRDSAGRWQKGAPSPNPGGRPKEVGDVRELAKSYTTRAIETLAKIMDSEDAPHSARAAAASALLDRAYGRPAQAVDARLDVQHSLAGSAAAVLMDLTRRAQERKLEQARVVDVTPS